jgi:hypothetical protein
MSYRMAGRSDLMSGIFFSYRRADTLRDVHSMHDWFVRSLPQQEMFFDLVSIRSGEDFPDRIESFIADASVVLVVIGPGWACGTLVSRAPYGKR